VRLRVVGGKQGLLGEKVASHATARLAVDRIEVAAGETIDFIVDCRESDAYDSYELLPKIELLDAERPTVWDAAKQFHGPLTPPLNGWELLAQILLGTNEFMFVD
jgi:hypothetical protein